jgi:hypothetical protein
MLEFVFNLKRKLSFPFKVLESKDGRSNISSSWNLFLTLVESYIAVPKTLLPNLGECLLELFSVFW